MRRAWMIAPTLALAALATSSGAESPDGVDWLQRYLFPPELIMEHQQEIGLTSAQRDAVKSEIKRAQSQFLDAQWDMRGEVEKLGRMLLSPRVDETAALAQAERVMGMENEVKKTHLALVIRIKNLLTDEQQERLRGIRPPPPPPPPALPPPHDHP
ncbi:MAG: hypothetical protein HY049_14695 [Acidobacteria bacterium]|nr:hypothetical protein [Acidobacteriota bacterium]